MKEILNKKDPTKVSDKSSVSATVTSKDLLAQKKKSEGERNHSSSSVKTSTLTSAEAEKKKLKEKRDKDNMKDFLIATPSDVIIKKEPR